MTKYRIRLKDGRVIGPFVKNQLYELKAKGHIRGQEEAQVFPTGDWLSLSSFDFYADLMNENKVEFGEESKEETFIIDLTKIRQKARELELDQIGEADAHPVELTETVRLPQASAPQSKKSIKPAEENPIVSLDLDSDDTPGLSDISLDSGDVPEAFDLSDEVQESQDKTLINPVAQQELEAKRRREKIVADRQLAEAARKKAEEEERQRQKALEKYIPPQDDATQVVGLDKIKHELLVTAKEEEINIQNQALEYHRKKRQEQKALENEDVEAEVDDEDAAKKKRKKIIVIIASLVLAYVILFPDDQQSNEAQFKHLDPVITFPKPFDKADTRKSQAEFNKGLELFSKGNYPSIVQSGMMFLSSYENDIENDAALSLLVRSYAEQLKYSRNKSSDSLQLFNLIYSKRSTLMQGPDGVIGLNLFYMGIDKVDAANDVVAKYLKVSPKGVTPDLFAVYLLSLLRAGKVDTAKQFFIALSKAPNKTAYTYDSLIHYSRLNEDEEKADEYLDEAVKNYPNNVTFLLAKAEDLIKDKKYPEALGLLEKSSKLGLDRNFHNQAIFLELHGLILAAKGNVKKATALFTKSLEIEDSSELRMKLADLSTTGGANAETDRLIAESKAVKFLVQAKQFFVQKSYELALSAAAKANDILPGYIPAGLFLSKVQMKLGQAKQSIKTLEELLKKYPEDKELNFAMIKTYIDTYKFNDAKNRIANIGMTDLKMSPEFSSLNARLFLKMGDSILALSWFNAALGLDPLNDADIATVADLFIKRGKYDDARSLLNKCIELDPVNPDYRISYANLVYATQDDQAAIGYLLSLLEEFGENPKFLSEIAIFYFRSGKVKDFEAYKEKLQKMPNRDKALYEFLIKAALLDERYEEVPGLVEELLRIEPGDIESMMTAGKVLFESGKLVQAASWFKRVQDHLPSYPKVQYYIARIKLLAGEIDDPKKDGEPVKDASGEKILGALSLIQKDIKENGESDISLVLLAEIYIQKGNLVEAENTFKKAQKINQKSYEALIGLADISTKRNNYDQALDLYKRALKQKSDEPVIHRKIGDVYRLLGQGTLAIESYQMYLEMNPEAHDKAQIESYINLMK